MQVMIDHVHMNFVRGEVVVRVSDGFEARFRLIETPRLTSSWLMHNDRLLKGAPNKHLVKFEEASQEAKHELKRRGISWIGPRGEMFIRAPNLYVERPADRTASLSAPPPPAAAYFAKRSSRVVRWLLTHPRETATIRELAAAIQLDESLVSRAVRDLRADGFVSVGVDDHDQRARRVQLVDGARLLGEWAVRWRRARIASQVWDIGTHDIESTVERLHSAGVRALPGCRWMLGGLSGAATVKRVVEPADVFVWVTQPQLDEWQRVLLPTEMPRGRGILRWAVAPDAFVVRAEAFAARHGKRPPEMPVADLAQLYLDCTREGERGLEAADAVKAAMAL